MRFRPIVGASCIALSASAAAYSFKPLQHLAGIAPYFEPADPPASPAPPQGCTVTRAAYLVRHAAIEANDFDYEEYLQPFLQKLSNTTVEWGNASPALAFLSTYKAPLSDKDVELLTREGKLEATQLGVDISFRYPDLRLLQRVWASSANRTVKSAQALIRGLEMEDNQINLVQIYESDEGGADTLTPYKSCPAYSSSFGSDQASQWIDRYTAPILARFRAQAPAFNWTTEDVTAMQELCGYETVIRGSSPFCNLALFSPDEWLSFEYANDIMYHYNTGYGRDISGVIGLPWLQSTLSLLTADTSEQDIYVSFTHRELLPTVAVALGLFNNTDFSAGNINDTMPLDTINYRRAWKSSHIEPFLGNVAIERLECSSTFGFSDVRASSNDTFYRALWNNAPQQLPGCHNGPAGSCSAGAMATYLQQRTAMFSGFSERCGVEYGNSTDVLSIYTVPGNGSSVRK